MLAHSSHSASESVRRCTACPSNRSLYQPPPLLVVRQVERPLVRPGADRLVRGQGGRGRLGGGHRRGGCRGGRRGRDHRVEQVGDVDVEVVVGEQVLLPVAAAASATLRRRGGRLGLLLGG